MFVGLLQKGSGSQLDFSQLSPVVQTIMGSGQQRDFHCSSYQCSGQSILTIKISLSSNIFNSSGVAESLTLLNVVTMATGPDGSIYVGDYNLIRKIDPRGQVETILEFR